MDENRRRERIVESNVHRVGVAYHPDLLLVLRKKNGFLTFLGSVLDLNVGKNMNPLFDTERLHP